MLATLVKGDPKAPFSIATTLKYRGGSYSIPWNAPLYPYLIMMCVKQGTIKYHFWVFGMTRPGIEPRSPGPLCKYYISVFFSSYSRNNAKLSLWTSSCNLFLFPLLIKLNVLYNVCKALLQRKTFFKKTISSYKISVSPEGNFAVSKKIKFQ